MVLVLHWPHSGASAVKPAGLVLQQPQSLWDWLVYLETNQWPWLQPENYFVEITTEPVFRAVASLLWRYSFIFWSVMNLQKKKKKGTHWTRGNSMEGYLSGVGGGRAWEMWVRKYKLPVRRWLSFAESNMQRGDYRQQSWTIYLQVAKRMDLEGSHHKKEVVIMWRDGHVR